MPCYMWGLGFPDQDGTHPAMEGGFLITGLPEKSLNCCSGLRAIVLSISSKQKGEASAKKIKSHNLMFS